MPLYNSTHGFPVRKEVTVILTGRRLSITVSGPYVTTSHDNVNKGKHENKRKGKAKAKDTPTSFSSSNVTTAEFGGRHPVPVGAESERGGSSHAISLPPGSKTSTHEGCSSTLTPKHGQQQPLDSWTDVGYDHFSDLAEGVTT